jgi:hypothetical protein
MRPEEGKRKFGGSSAGNSNYNYKFRSLNKFGKLILPFLPLIWLTNLPEKNKTNKWRRKVGCTSSQIQKEKNNR